MSPSLLTEFKKTFGVSLYVCILIYDEININQTIKHKHMLWAMYFLRNYPTTYQMSSWTGVSPNSYRNEIWKIITAISELKKVCLTTIICYGK